jgi:hypothetical protein
MEEAIGRTMRDRLTNIASRVNVGMRTSKNEKELREKKAVFDNHISSGTFKKYMLPRYQQTVRLLEALEKLEPPSAPALAQAAQAARAAKPIIPKVLGVMPTVSEVPAASSLSRKSRSKNSISQAANANNPFVSKPLALEGITDPHVLQAMKGLPSLGIYYDPYTGRQFRETENPLPSVEKAYHELKAIQGKVMRKATTLRKKNSNLIRAFEGTRKNRKSRKTRKGRKN